MKFDFLQKVNWGFAVCQTVAAPFNISRKKDCLINLPLVEEKVLNLTGFIKNLIV
jgi:hypothetical protein